MDSVTLGHTTLLTTEGQSPGSLPLTRAGTPPPASGNDRTTLVAYLRADHAGALLEILTEFASRGVNPDSHRVAPDQGTHRAVLLLDRLRGHITEERVGDALGRTEAGLR